MTGCRAQGSLETLLDRAWLKGDLYWSAPAANDPPGVPSRPGGRMNLPLVLFIAWFAPGVLCAIGSLWFMRTHEQELMDDMPIAQICGCVPPPIKWAVVLLMLLFGPIVVLLAVCEAVREARKQQDENVPAVPPVAAPAPVAALQTASMVLFALIGTALIGWEWSSGCPVKPFDAFLEAQARGIVYPLFMFGLAVALGKGRPWHGLREPLYLVPLYLVAQVPQFASMLVAWEGGWLLGIAGAAIGASAGAAGGWLFNRWTVPETETAQRQRMRGVALPIAFAVTLAVLGACNWGYEWVTPEHAWLIGVVWLVLALPGALVGRPLLGLLVMSPFALMLLVPLIGLLTVGWEGGWVLGTAGAVVGAAAGAVKGWLFNRWIMPEYDKRRAREAAARPPTSADGPALSESLAERPS